MYSVASSPDYSTHYLCWPETVSRECPLCGADIKFAHADNGKKITTLNGIIHQVVNYYNCTNKTCENSSKYFNPSQRYDFGKSYYGKDVLQFIADEIFLLDQTPQQIHKRFTLKYHLEISLRTIQRIYRDLLLVKAEKIDKNTEIILSQSSSILLAIDGQDPDKGHKSLWLFTDLLTNRVLHTSLVDSMPHQKIYQEIEYIRQKYNKDIVGYVSDKQNNLVKCMKTYYQDIPHQFCTFHFCQQMWKHLELLDAQLFGKLKKTLTRSYIHKVSSSQLVKFESHGKNSVKNIFSEIDADFQQMIRVRSKKFQFLRGIWLYRMITRYLRNMDEYYLILGHQLRIEQIYHSIRKNLNDILQETRSLFFDVLFLYDSFKLIYQILYGELLTRAEKQQNLDNLYGKLWGYVQTKNIHEIDKLRTLPLQSTNSLVSIVGEWVRLWNSYLSGLFSYYDFPKDIRTNVLQEQAFSQQKAKLVNRLKRKDVSYFIKTRGDLYLRFIYSTNEELSSSIIEEYSDHLLLSLRPEFQKRITEETKHWLIKDKDYRGFEEVLKKYHPDWRKIVIKKKLNTA